MKTIQGKDLAVDFFEIWEPQYTKNYDTSIDKSQRRQRFRRSIPSGYVKNNGVLVMEIKDGNLVYRDDDIISKFNQVL